MTGGGRADVTRNRAVLQASAADIEAGPGELQREAPLRAELRLLGLR